MEQNKIGISESKEQQRRAEAMRCYAKAAFRVIEQTGIRV
jgi:hypothetical protein